METTDPIQAPPIVDPRIALIWRHWLAVRGGRAMPSRRAIDPTAILGALPILYMYDYLPDSGRFFCRLAGEEIQAGSGVRGVKKHLDELFPPETGAIIERRYRRVVDTPCMVYAHGLMRTIVGMVMPIERVCTKNSIRRIFKDLQGSSFSADWGSKAMPNHSRLEQRGNDTEAEPNQRDHHRRR